MAYQLALLAAFALIGALARPAVRVVRTFRIEQRFGFNRMTLALFVVDLLKGMRRRRRASACRWRR